MGKKRKHRPTRSEKRRKRKDERKESRSRSRSSRSDDYTDDSNDGEDSNDDREGLVRWRNGDKIRNGRYKVLGIAGQGTFGTVLDVFDTKHRERVVLKVVRSVKRYLDAAYVEIDILEKLRRADPDKGSLVVRLYGSFTTYISQRKHVCICFERLGRSLYDFIKKNRYRGFRCEDLRVIGRQIVFAVRFCHANKLTHTDLKLENVLFVDDNYDVIDTDDFQDYRVPRDPRVRLIDFGGATFENERHARIINTRQYRAPEVIFGLDWSYPSDMWSIGCILAELASGELLFSTHADPEHLKLMEVILSRQLPTEMVDRGLKPFRIIKAQKEAAQAREKKASAAIVHSSSSNTTHPSAQASPNPESRADHHNQTTTTTTTTTTSSSIITNGGGGAVGVVAAAGAPPSIVAANGAATADDASISDCVAKEGSAKQPAGSSPQPSSAATNGAASDAPSSAATAARPRLPEAPLDKIFDWETLKIDWPRCAPSEESERHVRRTMKLAQLLGHFDTDLTDLVDRCLAFRPEERITAAEAFRHPFFTGRGKEVSMKVDYMMELVEGRDPDPARSRSCERSRASDIGSDADETESDYSSSSEESLESGSSSDAEGLFRSSSSSSSRSMYPSSSGWSSQKSLIGERDSSSSGDRYLEGDRARRSWGHDSSSSGTSSSPPSSSDERLLPTTNLTQTEAPPKYLCIESHGSRSISLMSEVLRSGESHEKFYEEDQRRESVPAGGCCLSVDTLTSYTIC